MKNLTLILAIFTLFTLPALAKTKSTKQHANLMDELDPKASNIEEILKKYDAQYERETGKSAHLTSELSFDLNDCFRNSCSVWADVSRYNQKLYLYIDGVLRYAWPVSTGSLGGNETPDFDTHPNGRIYDKYTSTIHPEGDYKGLGNMPYAVFISGGYAIHGTTQGNWPKLGHPASHGCIRLHPDNAKIFNLLVRSKGIRGTWITVEE